MLTAIPRRNGLSQPDLIELFAQIQSGDQTAFEHFYDATVRRVFASALRITLNHADAEEITCEAYQLIWSSAKCYDATRGHPYQWLMVITRNRALDHYRRRRRMTAALQASGDHDLRVDTFVPEKELFRLELAEMLGAELSKLPALQTKVLRLAFFDELTHREISQRCELPLGTVKSLIARGLLKLRNALRSLPRARTFLESYCSPPSADEDAIQAPEPCSHEFAFNGP